MPNYDRNTGNAYSTAGDVIKAGVLAVGTLLVAALGKALTNGAQKQDVQRRKQDLQNQIAQCDQQINDLRASLLGNTRNRGEIKELQEKRAALQEEYNNL